MVPAVERSCSGQGAHVWFFFSEAVPATMARRFGRLLGGERPADRIQQGKTDDVLALIAQLRDGAFV